MAKGRTTTDTLAHLPAYESSRMTEARRDAYQHDVDSSLDSTRDGHLQIPKKDMKRAVFLKCPTRLLREPTAGEDEGCPLFNVNWQDTLDPEEEEETTKYYSVRADLLIDDGTGARIPMSSVVDSGAAWTALRHEFLTRTAPRLLELLLPSKRRFKDAQGNPMAISGRIPLTVWMGDLKLNTYAYVFPQLSVDCLLGVNTLSKNGMIIDCNAKRLYVAGTPSNGVPIRTALCDTCDNCPSRTLAICTECSPGDMNSRRTSVTYDADRNVLRVTSPDGDTELPTVRSGFSPAKLRLEGAITIEPGRRAVLDPRIIGLDPDRLTPTLFRTSAALAQLGLLSLDETVHNPTSVKTPFMVSNPTDRAITCPANLVLATESRAEVEEEFATLAAVLEDDTANLRGVDDGGIEDLRKLGFNLDGAIDPDLPRMPDGRYQPLHEDKKRELYVVALSCYYRKSMSLDLWPHRTDSNFRSQRSKR